MDGAATMNQPPSSWTQLRARAGILLWRHGWAWVLSALLAIAASGLHFQVAAPARQASAQAQAQADLERSRASLSETPPAPPDTERERLLTLQSTLGAGPEVAESMRHIVALARAEGIVLAQSDYRQQLNPATRVTQVQITQPLRVSFPQLRRYVESVLGALPNVSLDQISARRENVGEGQVEARIQWSLWLYAPSAAPASASKRQP